VHTEILIINSRPRRHSSLPQSWIHELQQAGHNHQSPEHQLTLAASRCCPTSAAAL